MRYGLDKYDRGERLHDSRPPSHPVHGLPEPRPLWLWNATPRQDGVAGDTTDIFVLGVGQVTLQGHIEVSSDESYSQRRRFVRSQRCTEPGQNLYCNDMYKVRLSNSDPDKAISCTCPSWDGSDPCKHMISVEKRIYEETQSFAADAYPYDDGEFISYLDYLQEDDEEEAEAPVPDVQRDDVDTETRVYPRRTRRPPDRYGYSGPRSPRENGSDGNSTYTSRYGRRVVRPERYGAVGARVDLGRGWTFASNKT